MGYIASAPMAEENFDGSVAEIMQQLARERGLRVKDLIVRTGLSRPTVSRHFNGKLFPSVEDRERYARAFRISPDLFETLWQERRREREGGTLIPPEKATETGGEIRGNRLAFDELVRTSTPDELERLAYELKTQAAKKRQKGT